MSWKNLGLDWVSDQITNKSARDDAINNANQQAKNAANASQAGIAAGKQDLTQAIYGTGGPNSTTPQTGLTPDPKSGNAGIYNSTGTGAKAEINTGANLAENALIGGNAMNQQLLSDAEDKALGTIPDYLQRAQQLASQYYDPFNKSAIGALQAGDRLGQLTGATPTTAEQKAALIQDDPMFQQQEKKSQLQLENQMRAKGLQNSAFAAGKSADLTAQNTADQQQRQIAALQSLYNSGLDQSRWAGNFGIGMGEATQGAGNQIAGIQTNTANNKAAQNSSTATNIANTEMGTGTKLAGLSQDYGNQMAAADTGAGAASANAYAAAAQNAMASYNQPSVLQTLTNLYGAGKTLWGGIVPQFPSML